jgi:hypothetical protein
MSSPLNRRHLVRARAGRRRRDRRACPRRRTTDGSGPRTGRARSRDDPDDLDGAAASLAAGQGADGVVWLVDLGNPNQTERSGFTATSAKAGDAIVVLGNRHKDKTRMHMKAVRITIAGKNYDMYPERIRTN